MQAYYSLSIGEGRKFERMLADYISAPDVRRLIQYPEVLEMMEATMRAHPRFHLIHGRFHSLQEKLAIVRAWPGIAGRFTDQDFDRALEDGKGRIERFEQESPKRPLLDLVVSVYLGSIAETFLYGRARLRDTFGEKYDEWHEGYKEETLADRLTLLEGMRFHKNCIRIEVVDLGAYWNREEGVVPAAVNDHDLAGTTLLFCGAEDPDWIRQMDPNQGVPYALMGALQLAVPGRGLHLPELWRGDDGGAGLCADHRSYRFHNLALPVLLWEE